MSESKKTSAVSSDSVIARYEVTDASAPGILAVGIGALLVGFAIFMIFWWLFNLFKNDVRKAQVPGTALLGESQLPPEPRLQLSPRQDLEALREKNREALSCAGWVNRKEGWVHIPIDDAMELLVSESQKKGRK